MSLQPKLVYGQDELANVVALYESYLIDVEPNLVSEQEMSQKGERFLTWVNELLAAKFRTINQIAERSIEIFKQISIDEVDISTKFLELQHECIQKNTAIESNLQTIKIMETKLTQRENEIYKMRQEISELTQKIDKQQHHFKRQTKEFKKTFRIIQENTESDKQIFDSIHFEYEYEKQQKDMLKDQVDALLQEKTVFVKQLQETKRLLKASENKLEWQIKKKISLQDVLKDKDQMMEKLLHQIEDLKDTIKNPYDNIQEDHLDEKEIDYSANNAKSLDKNTLSEQMALRQSFFSEADLDEDFIRRNSFRKSFDEDSGNPSDTRFDYPGSVTQNHPDFHIKKVQSMNENHGNHGHQKDRPKGTKSSFHQQHNHIKIEEKPASSTTQAHRSTIQSPNSILIKDFQKSPVVSPYERTQKKSVLMSSPEVNQFDTGSMHQKQDQLQIITQKVQSETQSSAGTFRRYVPDLYFAHFLLTSQAVKIKEDCEIMLNIDVKQYYQEIIDKRIPMHVWDDWIRDKLRAAVKEIKARYLAESKRQIVRIQG